MFSNASIMKYHWWIEVSGGGAIGRVVTSNTRGPGFESRHLLTVENDEN